MTEKLDFSWFPRDNSGVKSQILWATFSFSDKFLFSPIVWFFFSFYFHPLSCRLSSVRGSVWGVCVQSGDERGLRQASGGLPWFRAAMHCGKSAAWSHVQLQAAGCQRGRGKTPCCLSFICLFVWLSASFSSDVLGMFAINRLLIENELFSVILVAINWILWWY